MRLISEIRQAPKRPDRFEILVDGDTLATLGAREISELRLREGMAVSDDLRSRIHIAGEGLRAYDRALAMLARAPRSTFDLRRRLMTRGEPGEAVRYAIRRLEAEGIADDERFAVQYARSRLARGATRAAILTGLLRVAVDRSLAEQVIARVASEEAVDESTSAVRAASRKFRSLERLDPVVARRRLVGFLKRRGFSASDIRNAIKRMNEQDGDSGP